MQVNRDYHGEDRIGRGPAKERVEAERSDDAEIDQRISDVVPGIGPDGYRSGHTDFFTTSQPWWETLVAEEFASLRSRS